MDEDNSIKVILITSKTLPIVKAKLTVYKKYKQVIHERKIFLQHEHEEFDDIAKMIAYQKLMEFCSYVESVINAFSVDLYKIITDYEEGPLTAYKIKQMCFKAFNESMHPLSSRYFWFRRKMMRDNWGMREDWENAMRLSRTRRGWRKWVVTKIHQKISKKEEMECTDAWREIWDVCRQTVQDLGSILSGLEEFRTRVLPVDQNKGKTKCLSILLHLLKIYTIKPVRKK